jgi:hypothetical protein
MGSKATTTNFNFGLDSNFFMVYLIPSMRQRTKNHRNQGSIYEKIHFFSKSLRHISRWVRFVQKTLSKNSHAWAPLNAFYVCNFFSAVIPLNRDTVFTVHCVDGLLFERIVIMTLMYSGTYPQIQFITWKDASFTVFALFCLLYKPENLWIMQHPENQATVMQSSHALIVIYRNHGVIQIHGNCNN